MIHKNGIQVDELVSVLKQAFPKNDSRPEELGSALAQMGKLGEWKELHNALDNILLSFNQFSSEVQRADVIRAIPPISTLKNLWYAVSVRVDTLLEFAKTIEFIGEKYNEIENTGIISGENWAVKISSKRNQINFQLGLTESSNLEMSTIQSAGLLEKGKLLIGIKPDWWNVLFELNNEFNHITYEQLHLADKRLRETATELYRLSKSILGS